MSHVQASVSCPDPVDRRLAAFEDRYGPRSHARLLELLRQPCNTFARIAEVFGVTRERVRQWQRLWLPEALSGRARRRQCGVIRQRRRVLGDPLFQTFYRHLRARMPAGRLALVPAREGFRRRVVRVDGHLIFVKAARPLPHRPRAYALAPYRGDAALVYVRLSETDFLLVPARLLPRAGTTFLDTPASKYRRFRNSVVALDARLRRTPAR